MLGLPHVVAAPSALNPLPSHGIKVSEEALSPAMTITRSARPTCIMSYATATACVAPNQYINTCTVTFVLYYIGLSVMQSYRHKQRWSACSDPWPSLFEPTVHYPILELETETSCRTRIRQCRQHLRR